MLLFLAKLKVIFQNSTLFFHTPEEAWSWVEERLQLRRPTRKGSINSLFKRGARSQDRTKDKHRRRGLRPKNSASGTPGRALRSGGTDTLLSDSGDDVRRSRLADPLNRPDDMGQTDLSERED